MNLYKQDEALLTEMKQTIVHDNEVAFWNIGQSGVGCHQVGRTIYLS